EAEPVEESAAEAAQQGDISPEAEEEEMQVAPLAMAPEDKPEAWLGQFLLELDLAGVTRRGTVHGASLDTNLIARLKEVRAASGQGAPLDLLEPERAARLRQEDWAAWWRAQDMLSKYCYATL